MDSFESCAEKAVGRSGLLKLDLTSLEWKDFRGCCGKVDRACKRARISQPTASSPRSFHFLVNLFRTTTSPDVFRTMF
ncbi:hypothetical protein L596_004398 [Steinernema carpocapsae]|uniref:Uncharacterized protein n=1 Tax=Steinernema carpocapsae TaxID=34508 RepID=A0A4U8UX74_STECR|nr:hypothetical protein L596_004398 [Steinernema carpocapsae]